MNVRADTAPREFVSAMREQRLLLLACFTIVLVVAVYWQSFSRMTAMWWFSDYQHGWLVYPISLYLLWRKRYALASVPLEASWIGVALAAICILIWTLARTVGVQVIEFASVSLVPLSVFWAVAGTRALKVAAFPLVLLVAAVPTGQFLVFYLQESTAGIATALLTVAAIPAFRDGNFLTLPGGSFEVAEACGGLRYLLAAMMASLAYAYLTYARNAKRVLFVAIAATAMVLANGVRAFIVMVVASATNMQVFTGKDHVYFGMLLFAATFAGLIYAGERYKDCDRRTTVKPHACAPENAASLPAAIAVLLFLAAGPALMWVQARQSLPVPVTADLPLLPDCRGPVDWNQGWAPEFQRADHVQGASYECGDFVTGVYFASYSSQKQGKELISSDNRVWPYEWRRFVEQSPITFETDLRAQKVQEVYVDAPQQSVLIWYWYQVGDSALTTPMSVKLRTAVRMLTFRPVEASIIAVTVEGREETSLHALRERLQQKAAVLASWYRHNRAGEP